MPFKSEAQRKKFHVLESQGKISKDTVAKWEAETPNKSLPEKVSKRSHSVLASTRKPRRTR